MDRVRLVSSFGAAALALLLLQAVIHFGYSTVQGIVVLAAICVVAVLAIGITSFAAGALAFLAYYVLDHVLGDPLLAAVVVAVLAAAATLAQEGRGAWKR